MIFLLFGCATRIDHASAPQELIDVAQNFQIEEGKGRVYFFMGRLNGDGAQINEATEIYVNDNRIVTLGNKDEYAFIDLTPGTYALKSVFISSGAGLGDYPPVNFEIKTGDIKFLAITPFNQIPPATYALGAIGVLGGGNMVTILIEDETYKNKISQYKLISLD